MNTGLRNVAQRIVNAEVAALNWIKGQGFSEAEAVKIFNVYRKVKAIKIDAIGGQFSLTHGGFADREVMERALAQGQ